MPKVRESDDGSAFELGFGGESPSSDEYGLGGRSNGGDGAEGFGADLGFRTTETQMHDQERLNEEFLDRLAAAKVTREQALKLLGLANGHVETDENDEIVLPPNLQEVIDIVGPLQRKELIAYIYSLSGWRDAPELEEALKGIGRVAAAQIDVERNNGELNPFGIES